jgi:nicotinamide riboside kinase
MTQIINIIGAAGIGKSTLSSLLFGEMKQRGYNVELVREFVKKWAWDGRKIGEYDQIYLFGKQAFSEFSLYGKVDWIVTDSPVILSAFYDSYYTKDCVIHDSVFKFLDKAQRNGIKHHNFLLKRFKKYDPRGRYESEEQIKDVDNSLVSFLDANNVKYTPIEAIDNERTSAILNHLFSM